MQFKTVLEMRGITKSFGSVQALKDVHLELQKGEILALMGENGAGKSTLMNILDGVVPSDAGEICINGEKVRMTSPIEAKNCGIAKIHQELQMVPELTVAENIWLGREPRKKSGFLDYKQLFAQSKPFLDALDLHVKPNLPVKDLRVGEQQLVEIAKALSLNAKILIMDEPTSALSNAESQKLFQVIRKLSAEGVSIIYISHRMDEIFELTNRITVLRDGEYISTVLTKDVSANQLVNLMVGRSLTELFPKRVLSHGDELFRIENLNFKPLEGSHKRKLIDVSFSLHRGEILGIAGLMGAGRSELAECLFGMHQRFVQAKIRIKGKQVHLKSPKDAIKQGIAFVTEDRKDQGLVLGRSIGENMSLPLLKQLSRFGFMNQKLEREKWQNQLNRLKIKASSPNVIAGHLSGGNQQKVVLGRWMLTKPEILILDEPTRGIDIGAKAEIYQLIHQLAAEGMGIIMISSELPEILGMSDRILTFCEGRLSGEFSADEANQEKILTAATMFIERGSENVG